jgi:hypothetical protein
MHTRTTIAAALATTALAVAPIAAATTAHAATTTTLHYSCTVTPGVTAKITAKAHRNTKRVMILDSITVDPTARYQIVVPFTPDPVFTHTLTRWGVETSSGNVTRQSTARHPATMAAGGMPGTPVDKAWVAVNWTVTNTRVPNRSCGVHLHDYTTAGAPPALTAEPIGVTWEAPPARSFTV